MKENRIVDKLISKTYFKMSPEQLPNWLSNCPSVCWDLGAVRSGAGDPVGAQTVESTWARRGNTVRGLLWFPVPGQPEGSLTWGRGARSQACSRWRDRVVVCSVMAYHTFSSEALSS